MTGLLVGWGQDLPAREQRMEGQRVVGTSENLTGPGDPANTGASIRGD